MWYLKLKEDVQEFSLKFPEYANINVNDNEFMDYPIKWKSEEIQFDKNNFIRQQKKILKSIDGFCLDDVYIIQMWIDYGKGIKDKTCKQI